MGMRNNQIGILLTGMGIGAAAGVIFARCSSAEMRRKMWRKAGEAKTYVKEQAGVMADRVGDAAEGVDQKLADSKGKVRDLNYQAKDLLGSASDIAATKTNEFIDKSRAGLAKAGAALKEQRQRLENA